MYVLRRGSDLSWQARTLPAVSTVDFLAALNVEDRARLEQRFESKIERRGADECWPYGGNLTSRGRFGFSTAEPGGRSKSKTKMLNAHTLAYALWVGPTSEPVKHTCGNLGCVNPAHLRAGESQNGNGHKRMSPVERVKLMRRIAAGRTAKKQKTWDQLAKETGVPARTLRYNYANYEAEQDNLEDPLGIVDESLHIYTEAITLLGEEAVNGDNSNARVGAIRSMLEATKGRLELLAAVERLPRRLGEFAEQRRMDEVLAEWVKVLEAHDVSPELVQALLGVVEPEVIEVEAAKELTSGAQSG